LSLQDLELRSFYSDQMVEHVQRVYSFGCLSSSTRQATPPYCGVVVPKPLWQSRPSEQYLPQRLWDEAARKE